MGASLTRDAFDRHAPTYVEEWDGDPTAAAMREEVWRVADRAFAPGGRILDAGCGAGTDARWLLSTGRTVVAIDASPAMVEEARVHAPGADVRLLAIERAGDADSEGRFDGALADFGVLNCADLRAAAAALGRAVAPGGAVVAVPMPRVAPAWIASALLHGNLRGALGRLDRRAPVRVSDAPVPIRYLSVGDIRHAFDPWFAVEEVVGLGFLLPPPRSVSGEALVRRLARIEAPLRRLPGLRSVGDHVAVVLRRRESPADARRVRRHEVHLHTLVLVVTHGCQSRCIGCDHRGPAGGEALDPETCGRLAAEARAMGCDDALITGGEPLVRPDIGDVLDRVSAAGLAVSLHTNGLALAKHAAAVARSCSRVFLSLDGHDADSYRATRGVDGFEAVRTGILAVKYLAPTLPVTARVTVTGANAGSLLRIARAAREIGCDGVSFLAADTESSDSFGRASRPSDPSHVRAAAPEHAALRAEIAALRAWLPRGFLRDSRDALDRIWRKFAADAGALHHEPPDCNAPWTSVVVEPDLRLRPCFFLPSGADARGGLGAGLTRMGPLLRSIDIRREDACARCVCWAKFR